MVPKIKRSFIPGTMSIPYFPELANAIDHRCRHEIALLIVQLDYWTYNRNPDTTDWLQFFDGVGWLHLSGQEIFNLGFNLAAPRVINRWIQIASDLNLVIVGKIEGDFKRWLRINHEELSALGFEILIGQDNLSQDNLSQGQDNLSQGQDNLSQGQDNLSQDVGQFVPPSRIYAEDQKNPQYENIREGESLSGQGDQSGDTSQGQNLTIKTEELNPIVAALAHACGLDEKIKTHRRDLLPLAAQLLSAGYMAGDLDEFAMYWREKDWRGKKGDPYPRPHELMEEIAKSRAWNNQKQMRPPYIEQTELAQEANPNCQNCSGHGFIFTDDPRNPWTYCHCIGD